MGLYAKAKSPTQSPTQLLFKLTSIFVTQLTPPTRRHHHHHYNHHPSGESAVERRRKEDKRRGKKTSEENVHGRRGKVSREEEMRPDESRRCEAISRDEAGKGMR